jgi:alkylated DNA repair dioxygenase AlkB
MQMLRQQCNHAQESNALKTMPSPQEFAFGGQLLPCDGSAILYPDFLNHELADAYFDDLQLTLPWEHNHLVMFGKKVPEPRVSCWHSSNGTPYTYSGKPRTAHPFNETLLAIQKRCELLTSHTFNGVLANLYRDGTDHMGWHADDEPVNGPEPIIASLSLGAERRFEFKHRTTGEKITTALPHGSLLVMSGKSQSHWLHRIAKSTKITEPRINLTFRHLFDVT